MRNGTERPLWASLSSADAPARPRLSRCAPPSFPGAAPVWAQAEAEVVWNDVPLADALYELAEVADLELVFALRLVEDVRVRGRYRVTDDPTQALRYILRGTGIRAERIRQGQYVLIREPLNVTPETGPEAFTGTLDGRVVDAETGEPLAGAHVWLVDLGLGDVVAGDGQFAVPLLPTGRYVVAGVSRGLRAGPAGARRVPRVVPAAADRPPAARDRGGPRRAGCGRPGAARADARHDRPRRPPGRRDPLCPGRGRPGRDAVLASRPYAHRRRQRGPRRARRRPPPDALRPRRRPPLRAVARLRAVLGVPAGGAGARPVPPRLACRRLWAAGWQPSWTWRRPTP